jgi:hypothetical protein
VVPRVASASAVQGYAVTLDCNVALTAAQARWIDAADIRVTPGVATGINANPPPPETWPIFAEVDFNHRYFWSIGGTTLFEQGAVGQVSSTTSAQVVFQYPETMRCAPTIALNSNANWQLSNAALSGVSITGFSPNQVGLFTANATVSVASGLVAGNMTVMLANNTMAARVTGTCEL